MIETDDHVRRQILGYIVSHAIFAVCELGVPDKLSANPMSLRALAEAVDADEDALGRFLRVLVAEGLFTQDETTGEFGITEAGGLLQAEVPGSLHHLVKLMSGEAYRVWGEATRSLRSGKPAFEQVFGKPYFDWLADNPAAAEEFAGSQAGLVELRMLPLVDWDWQRVSTVADIGGGNGALVLGLLERHSHLKGVVFDLPHVVAEAEEASRLSEFAGRLRTAGGSFFNKIPPGADIYVLSQILHDWDNGSAIQILERCREAIPDHGRLLIVEQILPNQATTHPMALLDLHMLVLLGGRERTAAAWRDLLGEAGFVLESTSPGPKSSLIEARPI